MIEAQVRADANAALLITSAPTESDLYRGEAAVRALCASYRADVLTSFAHSSEAWANIGGITAAVRRAMIDIPIDALEARLVGDDRSSASSSHLTPSQSRRMSSLRESITAKFTARHAGTASAIATRSRRGTSGCAKLRRALQLRSKTDASTHRGLGECGCTR